MNIVSAQLERLRPGDDSDGRASRRIVPFIPVVALWIVVADSGMFPRAFFPGPVDVVKAFFSPDLQGHPARLSAGQPDPAAHRRGDRHGASAFPLGILIGTSKWAHRVCWPILLFFQAIGDIAWLPILLIWFGFGLTTMTFVIVYTVLFPIVLNTVLGVESVHARSGACRAQPRRVADARAVGGDAARRAAQHHHRACATGSATAGAR